MQGPVALLGGTGRSGPGLALRLARAGTPVLIGSRDPARGGEAAAAIAERVAALGGGAEVSGGGNADVAERCELAALTVPYEGMAPTLPALRGPLAGRVVLCTVVPVRFDPRLGPVHVEVPEGSAAEQAAALLGESRLAAGLHSVSSAMLKNPERRIDSDVVVTGDDEAAKARVFELVALLDGARAVDGGPLRNARYSEQLTVLLLSINRLYRAHTGVRITDLPA